MSGNKQPAFSEATLAPGQMLGRYELLLPIATGGMGSVWAARLKGTRGFRKLVAIKTILNAFEDSRLEHMLYQEASLASQIHHPNVVETFELGEDRGVLFLVMELIHGEALSYILREAMPQGGIPLVVAVNLIGQVCKGLQAAHELCDDDCRPLGLVHRDISPPNIIVSYSGTVKIVDFGVATTTASATLGSGEIKGKISYLAPEQLRGHVLDARVDVFTTGILLYLLTAGRHPFKVSTEAQTINRILDDKPAEPPCAFSPGYPEQLERVVLRAIEKDREARYQSAAELLEALERAVPGAFTANSESVVADYVHELLRTRQAERRAMLRVAEDLAERSSPRDSVLSVGGVATLPSTPTPRARRWPLLASVVLVASAAGATFMPAKPPAVHGSAPSAPRAALAAPRTALASDVHALEPEAPLDQTKVPALPVPTATQTTPVSAVTAPPAVREGSRKRLPQNPHSDAKRIDPVWSEPASAAQGVDAAFLTDPEPEPSSPLSPGEPDDSEAPSAPSRTSSRR